MAEFDIGKTVATDFDSKVDQFSVDSKTPDSPGLGQSYWDFPNATEDFGYLNTIPEFNQAIFGLDLWTIGKGFQTDPATQVKLDAIRGVGNESFLQVLSNIFIQKKALGDGMGEIVRNPETNVIMNLKPLFLGDMRVDYDPQGMIVGYAQRTGTGDNVEFKKFKTDQIFHISNNRIGNSMHGTMPIESIKWVIDARNEALRDNRVVMHRNRMPVRIVEIEGDNKAKRDAFKKEYEDAINKGEVLLVPKGVVEFKDSSITIQNPLEWIRYLEDFFYKAIGVPKVILGGSAEFTEASSKIGYLTFEQVYVKEQKELEDAIWNQLALKIEFIKPVGLKDDIQQSEAANTGQVGIQPNETEVDVARSE